VRRLTEVADGVFVALSRRDTTTSTVVVFGDEALLIDPAWEPDELAGLADWLDVHHLRVVAGFATHAHHDHLLWHPRFGDATRWASPGTCVAATATRGQIVANLGVEWPRELGSLVGRVVPTATPLNPFTGNTETAELIAHDGHLPGHTAVWLPARRVLVAGDMLSDIELPLPFDPDDLPAYRNGLDVLAPFVALADVLIPGHGHPTAQADARLAADCSYLDDLAAGVGTADPRITNPGMAAVHSRLQELVAR
jgi:glyoxylase-like metal-dependent hydrolase (beta-lactamase superfamily II)